MAEIKDPRELILHCTRVNLDYMRLPAGMLDGYKAIGSLYQRLADQSNLCAVAWVCEEPCPAHEPAVDAFWWGVVAWAGAFGISIGVDQEEWENIFVKPHNQFAAYLKRDGFLDPLPFVGGPPADIILRLDALWMERVVKLTARWGVMQHLKDMPALREAQRLGKELRAESGSTREAYLESDLKFFQALFEPFPFSESLRNQLNDFIEEAETGGDTYGKRTTQPS